MKFQQIKVQVEKVNNFFLSCAAAGKAGGKLFPRKTLLLIFPNRKAKKDKTTTTKPTEIEVHTTPISLNSIQAMSKSILVRCSLRWKTVGLDKI